MFKHIPNPFIPTISDGVVVETGEFTTIHVSGQVGHEKILKVTAENSPRKRISASPTSPGRWSAAAPA